jgi:ribosomal protein S27E
MKIELSCPGCGNNRLEFPLRDEEPVRCEMCGGSLGTLAAVKRQVAEEVSSRQSKR